MEQLTGSDNNMSEIDWGDEKVLQPLEHSLYCFLSQVGLSDFRQVGINGLQIFVANCPALLSTLNLKRIRSEVPLPSGAFEPDLRL